MKHIKLGAMVLAVLVVSVHLFADTIAIVPFAYQGISQEDVEAFTEKFVSDCAIITGADIVGRSNFDSIAEQQKFQAIDWSNSSKVAKLGKAMNAEKIICGHISKSNNGIIFVGRMIDVNSAKILNSARSQMWNLESLLNNASYVVADLAGIYYIGGPGPGGGIIFYESEAGFPVQEADGTTTTCHYLECLGVELGNASWCNCNRYPYCSVETLDGVGTGKLNSQKIVDAHRGITDQEYIVEGYYTIYKCAAKLCLEYSTGTTKAGEWYLPSKAELNLIYQNLVVPKIININLDGGGRWSSSQFNDKEAYDNWFSLNGKQTSDQKDLCCSVCAVRAF